MLCAVLARRPTPELSTTPPAVEVPQNEASVKSKTELKAQIEGELVTHKQDREDAQCARVGLGGAEGGEGFCPGRLSAEVRTLKAFELKSWTIDGREQLVGVVGSKNVRPLSAVMSLSVIRQITL